MADPSTFAPPSHPREGEIIGERYRVEGRLGGGGMATVVRARHLALDQVVAIKIVAPAVRSLPGVTARFLGEARAATRLKGNHVVRVFDVGTIASGPSAGAPYLVMEYLEGQDLDDLVAARGALPTEEAVDYVLQACEALAEVHGAGIVHRDLKPANLFLTRGADGSPTIKLIDFGISRDPISRDPTMGLTQPEQIMGSPRYMAPEQMESAASADARSDIWGLGVVLYELLSGAPPIDGDTPLEIYAATRRGPPPPPSSLREGIPRGLDAAVLRCLRADPSERFDDVAELARALAPFGPAGSRERAEVVARVLGAASARADTDSGSISVVRRKSPSARESRGTFLVTLLLAAATVVGLGAAARVYLSAPPRAAAPEAPAAAATAPELPPPPPVPRTVGATPPPPIVHVDLTSARVPASGRQAAAPAPSESESAAEPVVDKPQAGPPMSAPPPAPVTVSPPAGTVDLEKKLFEERK